MSLSSMSEEDLLYMYDISQPLCLRSWSGYGDELCWAALWLNRATGDSEYLQKAQAAWDEFELGGDTVQFSWDDKRAGVFVSHIKADIM